MMVMIIIAYPGEHAGGGHVVGIMLGMLAFMAPTLFIMSSIIEGT